MKATSTQFVFHCLTVILSVSYRVITVLTDVTSTSMPIQGKVFQGLQFARVPQK